MVIFKCVGIACLCDAFTLYKIHFFENLSDLYFGNYKHVSDIASMKVILLVCKWYWYWVILLCKYIGLKKVVVLLNILVNLFKLYYFQTSVDL